MRCTTPPTQRQKRTMTINQQSLRDLYERVAAGDDNARREFDCHVLPLLEIVVGRRLRQRHDNAAETQPVDRASEHSPETSAERLRQISIAICERLAARSVNDRRPRSDMQFRPILAGGWRSPGSAPAPETIFGD